MDPILPVYLNQRLVFDLVAMLQGGIATVTKVHEAKRDSESLSAQVGGQFGLSEALSSLLNVNLSGKAAGQAQEEAELQRNEERVHTPASLLFTLRELLIEKKVLAPEAASEPSPGRFVEFTASLQRNPLIEGLDALVEILDLVFVFTGDAKTQKQKGKRNQKGDGQNLPQLQAQLKQISASLRAGGTQDLVADQLPSGHRAVLTVEEQFLSDPSLSDLVDGTFTILGKVIRVVDDPSGSISLLRKTALNRVPPGALEALTKAFSKLQMEHDFSLPEVQTEIPGPVIQILPIGIFS